MPIQPPRIGAATKRMPWVARPEVAAKRKRGRAGQRDRAAVLERDPLCVECLKKGITRASTIADHKVPLAWGGDDTLENKQGLCEPCHDMKSAGERAIDAEDRRRF